MRADPESGFDLSLSHSIHLPDEAATIALGALLAHSLERGDVVYLTGDLGTGKSTLARAIIRALTTPDQDVPSPTFTLIQVYDGGDFDIAHLDLYRLNSPEDIYEIGLFELQPDALTLIEWPENLGHLGFDGYLKVGLIHRGDSEGREATVEPVGGFRQAFRKP